MYGTESTKCTLSLLLFFYYDTIKLTKNDFFLPVLYKVNGAMFEKSDFFSVSKMVPKKFLQSLRDLHCWIAIRLEYTNP